MSARSLRGWLRARRAVRIERRLRALLAAGVALWGLIGWATLSAVRAW